MKVIEENPAPNQWPRRFTCGSRVAAGTQRYYCGSVLELEPADVRMPGQLDGDQGWFVCPVCHQTSYLDADTTRDAARARVEPASSTEPT